MEKHTQVMCLSFLIGPRTTGGEKKDILFHIEDIELVVAEKQEVLIVGTGNYGLLEVLPETKKYIESKGIELIVEATDSACEMYKEISKNKKAVAALHLTC